MNKIRRVLLSQRGEGRGKVVVGIIIVAVVVFGVSKFYPPIKTHMELKKVVEDFMASNGRAGENKIYAALPDKVTAIKKDLGRDDIIVTKRNNKYVVTIDYVETVVIIPDKYSRDLDFHIEAESRPIK
jgi:hypothetical protein